MQFKGTLHVSTRDGKNVIITVQDQNFAEFLELRLTYRDFVKAIASSVVKANVSLDKLDIVGKEVSVETLEFPCAHRKLAPELAQQHCPEGWIVYDSFNSQGSFFTRDGVNMARCTIRKYE